MPKTRLFRAMGFILSTSLLAACNSKFVEKKAESVDVSTNMSAIMDDKAMIDEKLNGVEEATKKISRINSLLKRAYSPADKGSPQYSPVDFLVDLNEELKGSVPKKVNEKYVRNTIMEVPGLSEECKSVEVLLEMSQPDALTDELAKAGQQGAEVLKYSVRGCGTDGMYLPLVEASWEKSQGLLSINSKNIAKIFNRTISDAIEKNWNCGVQNDSAGIIENIYCVDIDVMLSRTETALIDSMSFNNKGDIRFEASARIVENNKLKATASIVLKANGEVDYKLDKTKPQLIQVEREDVGPLKAEKE